MKTLSLPTSARTSTSRKRAISAIRRFACAFVGLLAAAVAAPTAVLAGSLSGTITNEQTGVPISGVEITVRDSRFTATSDAGGLYRFDDIPHGHHTFVARLAGYEDVSQVVDVANNSRLDIVMQHAVVQMEKFDVKGVRAGQALAVRQKRDAANIMEAVSSDLVGKFPDGNAAEALRRVPGISVEIDQDEGRYVVVRGIDSALNTVTLNNQLVGTPSEGGNRGIALDSVPADLISRLEVVKAVTPDLDGNAIGGSINIVTQSAFERPEGFLFGNAGVFYDNFSGRVRPNASVTFGRILDSNGKWGLVLGASYSLKDVKSQTVNTRSWANNAKTAYQWLPTTEQAYDYDIERERIGTNVALQYRPRDGHELALRFNYNQFTDHEDRQSVLYEYIASGTVTPTTTTTGSSSMGRANRQFRDYDQTGTIIAASLEGSHELSPRSTLTWQAGVSQGARDVSRRNDWEFRTAENAFPNTYDISGDVLVITPNNDDYYTPSKFPFYRLRRRTYDEHENVVSLQADLKNAIDSIGVSSFWKTGLKFVSRSKKDDMDINVYTAGTSKFSLGDQDFAGPEIENYFDGLFRYGPSLNVPALETFFADSANASYFKYDAAKSATDSLNSDWDAQESVTAGYALANIGLTHNTLLLAGARIEYTDGTYGAYEVLNGNYHWRDNKKSYTNVLPGIHFVWRPTKRSAVRAAWTNTIGRPNYSQLAATSTLDVAGTGTPADPYVGSLSSANPDLKPYRSMNLDLSLEYYLNSTGIVSVGAFYKHIKNPIYKNSYTLYDVTQDGYTFQQLSVTRPENANSGHIAGLEFNYQQFFTFLPSPLDGFGVNFNYTITDSSVSIFGRPDKLPFFKQSDSVANIALIYEKYGFEARVAWTYNDDYLDGVGTNTDTDLYVRGRHAFDAKASYKLTPKIKLYIEFLNFTEEPLREFTGVRSRENDFEKYHWKANAGVSWRL